jgi:hypothetical protein
VKYNRRKKGREQETCLRKEGRKDVRKHNNEPALLCTGLVHLLLLRPSHREMAEREQERSLSRYNSISSRESMPHRLLHVVIAIENDPIASNYRSRDRGPVVMMWHGERKKDFGAERRVHDELGGSMDRS